MLMNMWVATQARLHTERGASLVEYALLVALIAIAAIIAINALSGSLNETFTNIADTIPTDGGGGGSIPES